MTKGPADNIFVKILTGEFPSHEVYQNDHVYCFLDIFPQAAGHTLVIPKNFGRNVLEASEADLAQCWKAIRKLMKAVKAASGSKGVTVLTNTGPEAGQMVEYLHFHIIPRFKGDRVSLSKLGDAADQDDLAAMAAKIKLELG